VSNWLSGATSQEEQDAEILTQTSNQRKKIKQPEVGFFDGSASAIPRGVLAGAVKTYDVAAKPFRRVADHLEVATEDILNEDFSKPLDVRKPTFSDVYQDRNIERQNKLVAEIEQLEDRENTGMAGMIGFGVADYATRAVLGGLTGGLGGAIAVTGASEGNYVYENLTSKGVDSGTAAKVAAVDATVAAVATGLPISYGFKGTGGLLGDAAVSIGGATGLLTAGQYTSGEVLESGGYDALAKRYEVTPETMAIDLALNTLFFAGGRYARTRLDPDMPATVEQIEAETTMRESALVLNELDADNIAPVRPSDPIQLQNHLENLRTARSQVEQGTGVNVGSNVKGTKLPMTNIQPKSLNIPENAKLIAAKAQNFGIDPTAAMVVSHLETGGKFNADAKNPVSSAHGLFQVLNDSWNRLGGKDRNDLNEQIRVGLLHMRDVKKRLSKSLGRDIVGYENYMGHLLGAGGASKVLKADRNTPLIDIVRTYDPKRANAIVNNNGMKGLTVGQALSKWEGKYNTVASRFGGHAPARDIAFSAEGMPVEVSYTVRDISELTRDTTRTTAKPVDNIVSESNFKELANLMGLDSRIDSGTPIVRDDGVIDSGSMRADIIRDAYANDYAMPYREMVQKTADDLGLDISGIQNPVLVRTPLTQESLVTMVNQQTGAKPEFDIRSQREESGPTYDFESSSRNIESGTKTRVPKEIESLPRTTYKDSSVEIATFNDAKGGRVSVAIKDNNVVGQAREVNGKVEVSAPKDSAFDSALRESIQPSSRELNQSTTTRQSSNPESVADSTEFGSTIDGRAAIDIAMANPDQLISIQREMPDGTVQDVTMTMRELIEDIENSNKKSADDILATETAISCALRFGEA